MALDVFARRGKRPILIVVDKGTADYSIYELGDDTDVEIVKAIQHEIDVAEERPVAIETDNAICFSSGFLHGWLASNGIEHRYRPLSPLVEALIRQHSMDWGAQ
jgi:hypothetical protein